MAYTPTRRSLRRQLRLAQLGGLACFALLAFLAASPVTRAQTPARFTELTVERLNIVESDGRVRMVLANGARQADSVVQGVVLAPGRQRPAGMIFFNEEGTEVGGLVFSGRRVDGQVQASGSLTFDRYNQDQTIQLHYGERGTDYLAGVRVIDRPATSLASVKELLDRREATADPQARTAIEAEMMATMGIAVERTFVGRMTDGRAALVLSDAQSRPRLVLSVEPDGTARVRFLDAAGAVVREVTP
jgi:hypothetical protein